MPCPFINSAATWEKSSSQETEGVECSALLIVSSSAARRQP
jgi:hypothetical protein